MYPSDLLRPLKYGHTGDPSTSPPLLFHLTYTSSQILTSARYSLIISSPPPHKLSLSPPTLFHRELPLLPLLLLVLLVLDVTSPLVACLGRFTSSGKPANCAALNELASAFSWSITLPSNSSNMGSLLSNVSIWKKGRGK